MLKNFLKGSWRTSLIGYLGIAGGVLGFIGDVIVTQGLPQTLPEYFLFGGLILTGLGNKFSKDEKVSNSPHPVAATDVSEVDAAKPKL